jgi:hypothetical protein
LHQRFVVAQDIPPDSTKGGGGWTRGGIYTSSSSISEAAAGLVADRIGMAGSMAIISARMSRTG